jgi:hypothetical protein
MSTVGVGPFASERILGESLCKMKCPAGSVLVHDTVVGYGNMKTEVYKNCLEKIWIFFNNNSGSAPPPILVRKLISLIKKENIFQISVL